MISYENKEYEPVSDQTCSLSTYILEILGPQTQ